MNLISADPSRWTVPLSRELFSYCTYIMLVIIFEYLFRIKGINLFWNMLKI
jgi:hypothetical protein